MKDLVAPTRFTDLWRKKQGHAEVGVLEGRTNLNDLNKKLQGQNPRKSIDDLGQLGFQIPNANDSNAFVMKKQKK